MTVPSFLRGEKWVHISKNYFDVQVEDSGVHYQVFLCHLLLTVQIKCVQWCTSHQNLLHTNFTFFVPCADAITGANGMSGVHPPKL